MPTWRSKTEFDKVDNRFLTLLGVSVNELIRLLTCSGDGEASDCCKTD
jgi:hypothetical protein